jgi:G:T-mismatch repair DNA endonuclease (very short patch repair protein)
MLSSVVIGKLLFVNGCFRHGHVTCRESRHPRQTGSIGVRRYAPNRERDQLGRVLLAATGWGVSCDVTL